MFGHLLTRWHTCFFLKKTSFFFTLRLTIVLIPWTHPVKGQIVSFRTILWINNKKTALGRPKQPIQAQSRGCILLNVFDLQSFMFLSLLLDRTQCGPEVLTFKVQNVTPEFSNSTSSKSFLKVFKCLLRGLRYVFRDKTSQIAVFVCLLVLDNLCICT